MWRYALSIGLACSLGVNVWLLRKVTDQSFQISVLVAKPSLEEGDTVPDLVLTDVEGRTVSLSYSQSTLPTVVYILSTTCGWCDRNAGAVAELARQTQLQYRTIGIAMDSAKPIEYENRLAFPVYRGFQEGHARAYRLRSTPTTIVVSTQGKVVKVWSGAFAGNIKASVEAFFGVKLPAVSVEPTSEVSYAR
jgi:peroxiredoxin